MQSAIQAARDADDSEDDNVSPNQGLYTRMLGRGLCHVCHNLGDFRRVYTQHTMRPLVLVKNRNLKFLEHSEGIFNTLDYIKKNPVSPLLIF